METENELRLENLTDFNRINPYFACIKNLDFDNNESSNSLSDPLLSTSPSLLWINNLQIFSLQMQYSKLNQGFFKETEKFLTIFEAYIHAYQLKLSICQYYNQCFVKVFIIDNKVNVAILSLDYDSIDNICIFSFVINIFGNLYSIQIKHRVLDRNIPTSKLILIFRYN